MISLPNNINTVGLKISGGADSSLTAYLISKYIIDNNLKIKVIPITIIEEAAPFQESFSKNVIKIIENLHNFKFEEHKIYHHKSDTDKIQVMRDIEESLRDVVDLIISGTTQYPKDIDFNTFGGNQFDGTGPSDNRIGQFTTMWDNWVYTPLINLDKRDIANIYKEHNLMDVLFPYTRSCVSPTKDFSKHCEKCWWCKERLWAFGTL